jgi:hypothetical protein
MKTRVLAGSTLVLSFLLGAQVAHADFDWPLGWQLPNHDIALGLAGGVNFGETGESFNSGPSASVSIGYHHKLLGIRGSVSTRHEGLSQHVGGGIELTVWYVVLVGGGVTYWEALAEPGRDIPIKAWGMSGFVALPLPLARLGSSTLVIMPYARPGLRFAADGAVQGHHEAGLSLEWTTFGF